MSYWFFFLGTMTLIGIGILQPSWGIPQQVDAERIGKDIFFALDTSLSMHSTDIQPSRFEYAKILIEDCVEDLSSEEMGLVLFSGDALIQCPLTSDKSAFKLFLHGARIGMNSLPGTSFKAAISSIIEYFMKVKNKRQANELSKDTQKIIIFFTDGEDNQEGINIILEDLAQSGIIVCGVGIGDKEPSDLILPGNKPKLDKQGNIVRTARQDKLLRYVTRLTHGYYITVDSMQDSLEPLIDYITSISSENVSTHFQYGEREEQYALFIKTALFILVLLTLAECYRRIA